jgi:hypothetical protein
MYIKRRVEQMKCLLEKKLHGKVVLNYQGNYSRNGR